MRGILRKRTERKIEHVRIDIYRVRIDRAIDQMEKASAYLSASRQATEKAIEFLTLADSEKPERPS